ncbi:MAG: ATP-binding protein [Chloroflexota bacterium]
MIDALRNRIPIRARLTLWYVLLLAVTFTIFAAFLIFRYQSSMRSAIDESLQITVSKTISGLDLEDFDDSNRLTFGNPGLAPVGTTVFAMRLLSVQGVVWDEYGASQNVPSWGPVSEGYSTQKGNGEEQWRIFSQPVKDSSGEMIGWVQAAQSLLPVWDSVQDLNDQLLYSIPLIMIFAGLGGYFLADRALRPIERITSTAQAITAQDLSRRLLYRGPTDEVGTLARTFDLMLERLESAFERERRFISDAAHELRTPLTVLKGQIDVALSRPRSAAHYEKTLHELSPQVERLIRLSNALLFLSRFDQRQVAFAPVPVDLCELLEVLVEQTQSLATGKDLKVNVNVPRELSVLGDADLLVRLFLNLLENAFKYTPSGGQVTVTAMQTPDNVQIAVHNTGPGIPQEHMEHLFDRFYRVDADRSSQSGGSGLGLAIAREIASLHSGSLSVQSELNQGVTVTVHLPQSRP